MRDALNVATAIAKANGNVTEITVTAKSKGKATIKVTSGGATAKYVLTVSENNAVEWISSSASVAIVSNGGVSGKSSGSAVITAKTKNGKSKHHRHH